MPNTPRDPDAEAVDFLATLRQAFRPGAPEFRHLDRAIAALNHGDPEPPDPKTRFFRQGLAYYLANITDRTAEERKHTAAAVETALRFMAWLESRPARTHLGPHYYRELPPTWSAEIEFQDRRTGDLIRREEQTLVDLVAGLLQISPLTGEANP